VTHCGRFRPKVSGRKLPFPGMLSVTIRPARIRNDLAMQISSGMLRQAATKRAPTAPRAIEPFSLPAASNFRR
jgi:hypothetical protein